MYHRMMELIRNLLILRGRGFDRKRRCLDQNCARKVQTKSEQPLVTKQPEYFRKQHLELYKGLIHQTQRDHSSTSTNLQKLTQISGSPMTTWSVLTALVSTGRDFPVPHTYSSAETPWSRPDRFTVPNKKHAHGWGSQWINITTIKQETSRTK